MSPELKEVLFQALGEASMCWSETPKGIFKSDRCKEIGEEVICAFNLAAEKSGMCAKSGVQQLKAEIAALATDLECHLYSQFSEQMYRELRKRMRQLSAV